MSQWKLKNRKKLFLSKEISEDIKFLSYKIWNKHNIKIKYMETDKDHIHYMIEIAPNISISKVGNLIKSYTTYHIWNKHQKYLLKGIAGEIKMRMIDYRGDLENEDTYFLKEITKKASVIALSFIVVINCYTANIAYLKLHLEYENEYYMFSSIMNSVKNIPGFDEKSKIAIIGEFDDPEYFNYFEPMRIFYITGIGGAKNSDSRNNYIKYYLGMDINFASNEEIEIIAKSDEFKNMNEYPYYGHIKEINDTIVVKISDVSYQ